MGHEGGPEPGETILVWDAGIIRLSHWGLVGAVSVARLTGFVLGRPTLAWHLWAGIVVIAAVLWRIVWGGLGPTYARFSSFAYPPASVRSHLWDVLAARRVRHLGHSPLGAMMVFAAIAGRTTVWARHPSCALPVARISRTGV